MFRPSEKVVVNSGVTDERVHLRSVVYRGGYLPDTGNVLIYVFDVSAAVADAEGVIDERPVDAKISALKALRMGQVRTLIDHRGQSRNVVVEDVHEVEPQSQGLNPERSYVEVVMLEVHYS